MTTETRSTATPTPASGTHGTPATSAKVDDLTANTAATGVLHVYAFARVDALRVDYANGPTVIYPAGQWPVLSVWADLFDQPNT